MLHLHSDIKSLQSFFHIRLVDFRNKVFLEMIRFSGLTYFSTKFNFMLSVETSSKTSMQYIRITYFSISCQRQLFQFLLLWKEYCFQVMKLFLQFLGSSENVKQTVRGKYNSFYNFKHPQKENMEFTDKKIIREKLYIKTNYQNVTQTEKLC